MSNWILLFLTNLVFIQSLCPLRLYPSSQSFFLCSKTCERGNEDTLHHKILQYSLAPAREATNVYEHVSSHC